MQAIVRAQTCGFTAAQLFVKNNKQWFAPTLAEAEAKAFRQARDASGIVFFAHNSYLINLANQDPAMFDTSVKAMIAEVERAEALGLHAAPDLTDPIGQQLAAPALFMDPCLKAIERDLPHHGIEHILYLGGQHKPPLLRTG